MTLRIPSMRSAEAARHRRRITRAAALAAVALLVLLLAAAWRIRDANRDEAAFDLHRWPEPQSTDRLLIFAPHCDDETLGLSVLIQHALRAGAQVRVVFVTNGDGFTWSAERELRRLRVGQAGYVQFGMARQKEALAALRVSGVSPRNVVFLGYPDGGVSQLWLRHWTPGNAYTSRFTRFSRSPYPNSYTPSVIYCGRNVRADITRLIRDFRPTQVYCPHSGDNHPDHWATYAFVTDTLWQVERDANVTKAGARRPIVQGLYLIHRGDWPVPQGYQPDAGLPPPAGLARLDTDWRQVPAEGAEREVKRLAIAKYVSQMRVMKRFLLSFVRRNELVGVRRPGPLTMVPDGRMAVDGRQEDWDGIPVSVGDPSEDSIPSDFGAAGDILSIQAAEDTTRLYLRLVLRDPVSTSVAYDVYWHALPDTRNGTSGISLRKGVPPGGRALAIARGNTWEISVPRPPGQAVFVGVYCRYRRFLLDRSGWRILEPGATAQ